MYLPSNLLGLLAILLPLLSPTISAPLSFQTPLAPSDPTFSIQTPTRFESTVLARRLLALSTTGVLSTIFPKSSSNFSRLPSPDLASTPIALPDYLATCEPDTQPGNPTLLALSVSTSTRNAVAGSNVSLALSWWDAYTKLTHREPWSAANLPRMSLIGYLEEIPASVVESADVVQCYTAVHRDSKLWLPGDKHAAHTGVWMRMVVQEAYWIGGFGDRNFIGWFDVDEWRGVSGEEWEAVRLPGEEL